MRLKKPVSNTTCASRIFASRIFGDLLGPDRVLRVRLGIELFITARVSRGRVDMIPSDSLVFFAVWIRRFFC